jgi:hypothetical protein
LIARADSGLRKSGVSWRLQLRCLHLDRAQEKAGIKILPLAKWLDALPFG